MNLIIYDIFSEFYFILSQNYNNKILYYVTV